MNNFLSGLESVFSKVFTGIHTATAIAKAAEPGLALIPGFGPAIVAAIQAVVLLEATFPSAESGTPANNTMNTAKAALAVPSMIVAQPGLTEVQAQAILAAIVTGFNNAAKAGVVTTTLGSTG